MTTKKTTPKTKHGRKAKPVESEIRRAAERAGYIAPWPGDPNPGKTLLASLEASEWPGDHAEILQRFARDFMRTAAGIAKPLAVLPLEVETVSVSRRTLEDWEECLDMDRGLADAGDAMNELVDEFEAVLEMVKQGNVGPQSMGVFEGMACAFEHNAATALRLLRTTLKDLRKQMFDLRNPRLTLIGQGASEARAVAS